MTRTDECEDRIAWAIEREVERAVVLERPMEFEAAAKHTFRCVCCERMRREEDRREPESEVCVQCVREVGLENYE